MVALAAVAAGLSLYSPGHVAAAVPSHGLRYSTARVATHISGPRLVEQSDVVAAPVAEPPNPRNLLLTADGRLRTAVGTYDDCSGWTPLSHAEAAVDTCVTWVRYFIGHNPGVFWPLATLDVGSTIDYYDPQGTEHRLRVVSARVWLRSAGPPPLAEPDVTAQFQTCISADGSVDRILDAVEG